MFISDPSSLQWDVVVVGGGPAGCQAALGASTEGLRTLVVESGDIGGQIRTTPHLENFIGHVYGVTGPMLAHTMFEQASRMNTRFFRATATALDHDGANLVRYSRDGGREGVIPTRAVLIAVGATFKKLDIEGADGCYGHTVFYGPGNVLTRDAGGEEVVVVGGGNSAGQAVVRLAQHARMVHVIVRKRLSTSAYLTERIKALPNVSVQRAEVKKIEPLGDRCVVSVVGDRSHQYLVNQVILCTGTVPNTAWCDVAKDGDGFIVTGFGSPYATTRKGVFAVGDVRSGAVRRVTSAIGDGSNVQQDLWNYIMDTEPARECAF